MKTLYKYALVLSLLTGITGAAAQNLRPVILSDSHVMLRVPATKKYLLLPVEESADNDHIRVISEGKVVRELNVRLALNRADHFFPLRLGGNGGQNLLLDIDMSRNNTAATASKAPTGDFACWKLITLSDTFDTANKEKYRPLYHHTPAYGWMNDPNGLFYKDGVWHLYYQHNPYGSQWENMTWGHASSTDLVHWREEGEAIEPDALGTVFSGCAVVDRDNTAGYGAGAVIAYYTAAGKAQTQCMAVSCDDGKTFTKYPDNPVLTSTVADFRDPHILWYAPGKKWVMIVSEKQHMKIFSSPDLRRWTAESTFGEDYGSHDGVWECPDLLNMGGNHWVLVCNINPGGPQGGSATQYFTGSFDGHRFVCDSDPSVTKWMDQGKDHYATVTFSNAPSGRHVAMPWMSNWQYAGAVPTLQYRSANGIPRDLGYFEYRGTGYVSVTPSPEVLSAFETSPCKSPTPACRADIRLSGSAEITLSNAKGEKVVMRYDDKAATFSMDRTKSGNVSFSADFPAVTKAAVPGSIRTLRIFIDRSSIEAFDADGRMAMSNAVFPSSPYTSLKVRGGKAKIYDLKEK